MRLGNGQLPMWRGGRPAFQLGHGSWPNCFMVARLVRQFGNGPSKGTEDFLGRQAGCAFPSDHLDFPAASLPPLFHEADETGWDVGLDTDFLTGFRQTKSDQVRPLKMNPPVSQSAILKKSAFYKRRLRRYSWGNAFRATNVGVERLELRSGV